jgi:GT2 family glycosyltransferase/glycosyltransferase involved in cell wall biosynthesis
MDILRRKRFSHSRLILNDFTNSFIHEIDEEAYLAAHLDVKNVGLSAKYHFAKYGLLEKRPLSSEEAFAEWVLKNLHQKGDFSAGFPWVEMCNRYSSPQFQLLADTLDQFLDKEGIKEEFPGIEDCPVNIIHALAAIGVPDEIFLKHLDIPNPRKHSEVAETSILILNWNKPLLTLATISSLVKWVDLDNVEIVVIDNGSNSDNFSKLALGARRFKILSLKSNHFFGGGNNFGASKCDSKYLIFMNNDVIVESDISDCLVSILKSSSDIGTVGPLFIYPNRKVQEAGVLINKDGSVNMLGRNAELPEGWLQKEQVVDYTSAACVAIRRLDFEEIGGFDYIFEPAYYEDADLCLRVQSLLGKQSIFTPQASVIHLEHQTSTDPEIGIDFSKVVELNKSKFTSRWDLTSRSAEGFFNLKNGNSSHLFSVFNDEQVSENKKLHIYSPYPLTIGGGERYILTLASLLSEKYEVSMVFDYSYTSGRVKQMCRDLNISQSSISICNLDESRMQQPEILIIMDNSVTPSIYPHGKKNVLLCQFPFVRTGENFRTTYDNLAPVNAIVTYSTFVSGWVEKRMVNIQQTPIRVISPPISVYLNSLHKKDPLSILAIGRFFKGGHEKNLDFLAENLGNLNAINSNNRPMSLDIVGGVVTHARGDEVISRILSLEDANVRIHPDAEGPVLEELLHKSSVYWHAAGLNVDTNINPENCEHFGISPLEAMSAGTVPFVVNNGGPANYIQDGHNGFLYETSEELIEKTSYFLSLNQSASLEIRENSRRVAKEFSLEVFALKWENLLEAL